MDFSNEFIDIFSKEIKRNGSEELLNWLKSTDFFKAPASTKYHCACTGGLVQHSVTVYHTLMDRFFDETTDSKESFAICALLHDLCKVQFYKVSSRNVKNDKTGEWEKKPFYSVDDVFPYGHGEKSVFLIERFMRLKSSEAMAIRWHMGGFDDSVKAGSFSLSVAFEKYPFIVKLHIADLEATYLKERGTSSVLQYILRSVM